MTGVVIPNTSGKVQIDELTEGVVGGTGVFDKLMASLTEHLMVEFKAQRIRGTDYANVYMQLVGQTLSQAIQYTGAKAKLPLELQALEAQIQKTTAETALTVKQASLVEVQATKEAAEIELVEREIALKEQQLDINLKELELKSAQFELAKAQILSTRQDVLLKKAQLEIANKELAIKEYELKYKTPAEVDSINAQTALYKQKTITEKAETKGDVAEQGSAKYANIKVLEAQAKGFDTDARQKLLKLLLDTWATRNNADPDGNGANADNELWDKNIGQVVNHNAEAIGLTLRD